MSKDKKLFDSEDFDKQKRLFTSEDFDKQTESSNSMIGRDVEAPEGGIPPGEPRKKNLGKIIAVIFFAAVMTGFIISFLNSNTGNSEGGSADCTNTELVTNNDTSIANNVTQASDNLSNTLSDSVAKKPTDVKEPESVNSTLETVTPKVRENNVDIEGTTEALANDVIAGKYDNWPERERKLGKRYKEIQSKVNEMYRNGLVK